MTRDEISAAFLALAKTKVGQVEDPTLGHHLTPWVEDIDKRAHLPVGSAYCIAGATETLQDACSSLGAKDPVGVHGGTQEFWGAMPAKYKSQNILPGCICIYRDRKDHAHGHAAIVETLVQDLSVFNTIEFNTGADGGREGNGVYEKARSIHGTQTLEILGFVDVCQMIADANP